MADSRIDDLRRRLERDPGSRLFAQLAEEHRKVGEHAEAIRVARAGLAQHPSYPSARLTLGRALLDSGDPAGARAELEAALREAPDNILASRFLGQALETLGELGPALVQLQKTLKMAPGDRQLESQIVSLQSRLRSPQPVAAPRPAPDATTPMPRPSAPALEAAESDGEPLPPTIRIHMPGDQGGWGRRAPLPPPLPPTAAPTLPAPAAGAPPEPPVASAPPPLSAEPFYESDVAPTLPTSPAPGFGAVDETAVPTLPPGALSAEETIFEAEAPTPAAATTAAPAGEPSDEADPAAATPFSSSTLAELYARQGLVDRAAEVYRQVLAEEPGNERARTRLSELEAAAPAATARVARRQALERTIAGLEALLAAIRRR